MSYKRVVEIRLNIVMREVDGERAAEVARRMGDLLANSLDLLPSRELPDEVENLLFVGYDAGRLIPS